MKVKSSMTTDRVAAVLNTATFTEGEFGVATQSNLGNDKNTRLTMFTNELEFADSTAGSVFSFFNYVTVGAASPEVVVEARTANGRLWKLPVEFAGPCPLVPELSQVNFILMSDMTGTGRVQLTLVVNGERGKPVDIKVA